MPGISPEDERTVRHEQNHIDSLLTIDHGVKVTDNEACSSLEWSKNGCISLMANSTTTQVSQTVVVDGEMVLICVKRSDADSRWGRFCGVVTLPCTLFSRASRTKQLHLGVAPILPRCLRHVTAAIV